MLQGPPDAAGPEMEDAARLMGLALPDEIANPAPPAEVLVWADNWPAVQLFLAMQTQLRVSMSGVEGFDYAALPVVERRIGLSPRQAAEAFDSLRVMERALITWHREG